MGEISVTYVDNDAALLQIRYVLVEGNNWKSRQRELRIFMGCIVDNFFYLFLLKVTNVG